MKTIDLVIITAVTFLFSCAEHHTNNTNTDARALEAGGSLAGTEWVLTGYANTQLAGGLRNRTTIKFSQTDDELKVSGKAFINSYFGAIKIEESTGAISSIGPIGATKVGGSQDDIAAELFYFQNLENATSYKVEGDRLTLFFGDREAGYFTKK